MRWRSLPRRMADTRPSPVQHAKTSSTHIVLKISFCKTLDSLQVLFVSDLFRPIDKLAVELFLNRDVRHGCSRRSPMPVLLAGWDPHHVTGPNLLDRSAFTLDPATARRYDERLTERVRVPGR